jgi:hypothetical protein
MFTHKRKTKIKLQRNHKRRAIAFYASIAGFFLLCIAGFALFIFIEKQKPLFISPLPALRALAAGSTDDQQADTIKKALQDKSIVYSSVEIKDSVYIITLENGEKVTLSAKKDIITQISSLQFVLSRLTMEGRQFRTLDLQYDKPIIVFKE